MGALQTAFREPPAALRDIGQLVSVLDINGKYTYIIARRNHEELRTLDSNREHRFHPAPGGGTEVRTTMRVKGPLAFLWDRLVVRGIAEGMKEQTDALVSRARSLKMSA
jgi:hypothetical protein